MGISLHFTNTLSFDGEIPNKWYFSFLFKKGVFLTMEKRLSKYRDYSVLATDSFDKRRFNSLLGMSKKLQDLNEKVSEELYTFEPLLGDMWASLYKTSPQMKEEVLQELQINKSLLEKVMSDDAYKNYRTYTMLDDLTSAIATTSLGEKTYEWIVEQKEKNERIQQLMQQIQQLQQKEQKSQKKQNQQQGQQEQKGQQGNQGDQRNDNQSLQSSQTTQQLQEALNQLNQEFQQALNGDQGLSNQVQEAIQDAQDTTQQIQDLLGSGKGSSELKKIPLRDQIKLAELLTKNKKLRKIAEWAGRFKAIALKKQRSKHDKAIDRNGLTVGAEIENILPSEWGMYSHSTTKIDFLRRLVEGQTLQYDQKGKEELGKGPIVCCLDQSGSMRNLDTQAKGFLLALLLIAKKQRRDFAYIPFSNKVGNVRVYEKGKISSKEMVQIATEFMSGGTNFEMPLNKSLEIINRSRFKEADVVFITDGDDRVSSGFIEKFNRTKKEKDFHVLSLVIGNYEQYCKPFSDKVVKINDFKDTESHVAFEI